MTKELYIVEMLRLSEADSHYYFLGAYSNQELAELAGEVEKSWLALSYSYRVRKIELDVIDPEKLDWHRQSEPTGK